MSNLLFWDATVDPTDEWSAHEKANCDVWESMGGHYPYHLYFPQPGWRDSDYFTVLSHRADREVRFKQEIIDWLHTNCRGRFIDWPTLSTIQFQNKSDALMMKLVWG